MIAVYIGLFGGSGKVVETKNGGHTVVIEIPFVTREAAKRLLESLAKYKP